MPLRGSLCRKCVRLRKRSCSKPNTGGFSGNAPPGCSLGVHEEYTSASSGAASKRRGDMLHVARPKQTRLAEFCSDSLREASVKTGAEVVSGSLSTLVPSNAP